MFNLRLNYVVLICNKLVPGNGAKNLMCNLCTINSGKCTLVKYAYSDKTNVDPTRTRSQYQNNFNLA